MFDSRFGDTEGPLGFPMMSAQAKHLDRVLYELPKDDAHTYRKLSLPSALTQLQPGERADISWITTDDPDREGDMIRVDGMDDSQFTLNPIVTLNHAYWMPPVGLSLWRRPTAEKGHRGVLAKTYYPVRPDQWKDADWPPDECFALVQAGLMRGKSIGFLPLKVRAPNEQEVRDQPAMSKVRYIIEKWMLLEYACCYLPVQQFAVVEAVGKGVLPPLSAATQKAMGVDPPIASPVAPELPRLVETLSRINWGEVTDQHVRRSLNRLRGRIA